MLKLFLFGCSMMTPPLEVRHISLIIFSQPAKWVSSLIAITTSKEEPSNGSLFILPVLQIAGQGPSRFNDAPSIAKRVTLMFFLRISR